MDRRRFLLTSLAGALAAPLGTEALQAQATPKVGVLYVTAGPGSGINDTFNRQLEALGWTIGRNVAIEERYSAGRQETFPRLVTGLIEAHVDVIVAWSPAAAVAAKQSTTRIPIVFLAVGNPVRLGLVSSFAHPGGNVTGIAFDAGPETYVKGLQFLKEGAPTVARIAVLIAEDLRTAKRLTEDAARKLNMELFELYIRAAADVPGAVRKAKERGAQALFIHPSGLTYVAAKPLADLALENSLPSVHFFKEGVLAGGLLSFAPSLTDIAQRGAAYVDRILRGTDPADLPVEQPTKFELVINLKTAKALGLTIPPSLLARADQIIE